MESINLCTAYALAVVRLVSIDQFTVCCCWLALFVCPTFIDKCHARTQYASSVDGEFVIVPAMDPKASIFTIVTIVRNSYKCCNVERMC